MIAEHLHKFIQNMPKVELHVHLEGSIRPQTLLELAKRRGVTLPASDVQGLREWFQFRDFQHFVEIYLACSRCLRDPEDFQLIVGDFIEEQARQNVLYSEVHFTISTHIWNGVNAEEVADAMWEEVLRGEKRHAVGIRWIPDIVRNVECERADATLEWALDNRRRGVVALGLSGIEASPDTPFGEHFEVAEKEGLHRVAHAGEIEGPECIRSVLEVCRPERIGHGIQVLEDEELVAELAARQLPIEVCPTSNVCLAGVPSVAQHPFGRMADAGLRVSVNSDDGPLFNTTLVDEYVELTEAFGYTVEDLARLSRRALEDAFVGDTERAALEEVFNQQLEALSLELGQPQAF